ncbi:MAG: transglutaminase-like domain-containing protein [Pirellulales bacterium]
MRLAPHHCRPAAFEHFAAQLPRIDSTEGLVHAAIAVSMHELEDVEPSQIDDELTSLAYSVRSRVRSKQPRAMLAHLHHVLFDEVGLRGNIEDYYAAQNSYLPSVLSTRQGLPIVLSLIYKSVAERVGLTAHGVNSPGHFLAAVELDDQWMFVDPFQRGRVVTRDEIGERVAQLTGQALLRPADAVPLATHRQWIARMLLNLIALFTREGPPEYLAAMNELLALLEQTA